MTVHAHDRAGQRYNQDIPIVVLSCMAYEIKKGHSLFIDQVDKFLSRHYVQYKNIPYKVLYSEKYRNRDGSYKSKPSIVTVLPFDVDEYNLLTENYQKNRINDNINELKNLGYSIVNKEGVAVWVKTEKH